ncbi:3-oxoacyl-[acyl-carrier-protein] synthase III C-terminal domain-containing protein [Actinosynnema sp. NPDC050436]|uniref:3-oxoacyl-ACP synthase III family protein n=1 Tax=Actinosynnema sp. NPDC050436 TaxID=3155659 RepID=UPI0033C82238
MFGLHSRTVADAACYPSDLAAAAARKGLESAGWHPEDLDLLVFAAVSEDVEEPATAHIVADKIGARCPVFDLKNACNSVLNALQVADALIRTDARCRRVLVVSGETLSRHSRHTIRDRDELLESLASYSVADLGAAVLLEAADAPGIIAARFSANSRAWSAATLPNVYLQQSMGETVVGEGVVRSWELSNALDVRTRDEVAGLLAELDMSMDDMALVCVHQPSVEFTRLLCAGFGIPEDKVRDTVPFYGNVGAATLPLQLHLAQQAGALRPGDLVALLGVASGLSVGLMVLTW